MDNSRAKDQGRLRFHARFPSRFLSTPRDVIVYVPPGYDESEDRYPVFYLQDGQNLFDPATAFGGNDWRCDVAADELTYAGLIRPVSMVGIYNTGAKRMSEYTPTRDRRRGKGGKADRYAQMLARELKPFIDSNYRTLKAANHTAVGGSSLGALVSLEAGLEYPRVFGKLALLSPSVWWDEKAVLRLIRDYTSPVRQCIWLDIGHCEGNNPEQCVQDARELRDALLAKGWQDNKELWYYEVPGAGHNEAAWAARFGDILKCFFPAKKD